MGSQAEPLLGSHRATEFVPARVDSGRVYAGFWPGYELATLAMRGLRTYCAAGPGHVDGHVHEHADGHVNGYAGAFQR